MKRVKGIGLVGVGFVPVACCGCAGVVTSGEAGTSVRAEGGKRVTVLGSRIPVVVKEDCGQTQTASSVVVLCAQDLDSAGAPTFDDALRSRVPALGGDYR